MIRQVDYAHPDAPSPATWRTRLGWLLIGALMGCVVTAFLINPTMMRWGLYQTLRHPAEWADFNRDGNSQAGPFIVPPQQAQPSDPDESN